MKKIEERVEDYVRESLVEPCYKMPTIREIARKFRITQVEVLDTIESSHRFIVNVGCQAGTGGGIWEHESIGDYEIELSGEE